MSREEYKEYHLFLDCHLMFFLLDDFHPMPGWGKFYDFPVLMTALVFFERRDRH